MKVRLTFCSSDLWCQKCKGKKLYSKRKKIKNTEIYKLDSTSVVVKKIKNTKIYKLDSPSVVVISGARKVKENRSY